MIYADSSTQKTADSLPEIQASYDDSKWPIANQTETVNHNKPTTPTILYGHNYGFHTGNLLYRGHFDATGTETAFTVDVYGGLAFGFVLCPSCGLYDELMILGQLYCLA